MRKALNENPVAQVAIVAVLLAVAALFFMKATKKDSGSTAAPASPVAEGSTVSADAAATATPPATADPAAATAAVTAAATTAAPAAASAPVVPGPPLPPAVSKAQRQGRVVVLLIVRAGADDDRLLRQSVRRLAGFPGLAVFATRARGVARYARITQGVGVSRVPALVIVRPRGESGGPPSALVKYGFRGADSVVQAVRDALYRGPTVGYSPD